MLRQFAVYYRPWMGLFWLNFGCAVVSGLLELAFPLAVRDYIDWLLPQGNWTLTVIFAVVLCAIYVVNAGLMAIVIYWGHMLGINIETEMRRRAFDHLQRLSWGYFDRKHSGPLIARVTRDLEDIGQVAHHGPEDLIVAAFILMLTVHAPLTWMTVVIVPLAALLVMYFGGRMTATWRAALWRSCCWWGVFPAIGENRLGDRDLSERHRRVSPLSRPDGEQAGCGGRAGCGGGSGVARCGDV